MAINAKPSPYQPHATLTDARPDTGQALKVADLAFDHQIVVWALRMRLQCEAGAMRVQRQFFRALPPSGARIAFDSLQSIVATLQRHGTRPLSFRTLASEEISRDEFLLLTVFCAVVEEPPSVVLTRAGWLVGRGGRARLISAVASMTAAMASRHDRHATEGTGDGFPVTIH